MAWLLLVAGLTAIGSFFHVVALGTLPESVLSNRLTAYQ
jgi:hypothetical protein